MVQRSEHAHRALELARAEAEGFGHRYLGPEHLVLGVRRHGDNGASEVLQSFGVDLVAARTALRHLADRGVVPGPRPSDAELLGIARDRPGREAKGYRGAAGLLLVELGVDLDQLREAVMVELGGVQR